jgi:tRNA-2-methylthio-N6-dimethylallyladenosine synthase
MRRGYTAERYMSLLADARAAIADLAVTTDIIVGFPGETEEDFERTLEVASQAAYDSAYTFIFSPRPGTRAADMRELFVPAQEIADRFERLKVVIERSALSRNVARVGRIEEAIVEGPSKKDPAVASGRTRQGKLVHFEPAEIDNLVPGTVVNVRVGRAAPHHLSCVLVSSEPGPGRRIRERIPLVAG